MSSIISVSRFAIPIVLVVLLVGCSDRSSDLELVGPMDSERTLTHEQVQNIHEAAQASATAQPEFGSIIQTIQGDIDGISTSFDAETREVVVTISRDNGTELVIDTSSQGMDKIVEKVELGEDSPIDPRRGTDTRLVDFHHLIYEDGQEGGLLLEEGLLKARVFTSWDPNDLGDWITGGYWAFLTHEARGPKIAEVGAFIDGPEFDAAPSLPATGAAHYLGLAGGLFTAELGSNYSENSYASGEYGGRVQLTIAFDGGPDNETVMHGTISDFSLHGDHVDHRGATTTYGEGHRWRHVEMYLDFSPINAEGEVTGTLSASGGDVTSSEGVWGAVVSSSPDSDGNPRAIAGTQGAIAYTTDGSEFTFMGAFFAHSETRIFNDDVAPPPDDGDATLPPAPTP